MRDPRSHRRYRATRANWIPTADPTCCLCGGWVDTTLPGTHPAGPTPEHTLPVRHILAMATTADAALDLACDTSLWLLAHRRCQDRQGARAGNASPLRRRRRTRIATQRRASRRRASRAW